MWSSRELSVQLGLTLVCLLLFTSSAFAQEALDLEEGAACGPGHVCMKIADCFAVNNGVIGSLKTCSYDNDHLPILCCNPNATNRNSAIAEGDAKKTVSEKMCETYAEYVFTTSKYTGWSMSGNRPQKQDTCGRIVEPLITGGAVARLKEFPHMVQIGYGLSRSPPVSEDAWRCGGSLISERFVLSADHCTYIKPIVGDHKPYVGMARWARMGIVDVRKNRAGPEPQILKIVEWINKTDFDDTKYNDIVLFKLEKDVNFNPYVRPICLQVNQYIEADAAIATGFGKLYEGAYRNSVRLRKVSLNLVENNNCSTTYTTATYKRGIQDTQLCAGNTLNHDTCQGDSGGPLQIPIRIPYCMYALVGVTSGGGLCGEGNPGIYTRVSKYVPWIEKNVWPHEK